MCRKILKIDIFSWEIDLKFLDFGDFFSNWLTTSISPAIRTPHYAHLPLVVKWNLEFVALQNHIYTRKKLHQFSAARPAFRLYTHTSMTSHICSKIWTN